MNPGKFLPLALVFATCAVAHAGPIDPSAYSGLVWRNIGPFRGGRISAVSGVVGQPGVFYVGLPMGGVWKTTGAGTTWTPIFDDVKEVSSVGAVEVAPSDPNVIYVGMGDLVSGGAINEGNGVYKSTDAGKTWQHLGLDDTKQIPSILVDPHNPDLVMVAAQGDIHKKSEDRGLFRSTDGGKSWRRTLFVDDQTGVQKIAWAYDHPEIMLATTVRHYVSPGGRAGFGSFGGPDATASGTRLFKSTDKGLTWTELKGGGLPPMAGRTCVAIAANTNAQRMFLVGNFGLYRSDDGGTSWRRMDPSDGRVMNGQGGYNCGVYVDPKNPDVVYLINTSSYRSLDGGKTFAGYKGAPGGDDPQQMWIDPTDGKRIILGTDQGATVSLDGGQTWSSWYNQATAQIYHLSVDNSYPYWVYGTQQDSGSIGTRSRGNFGAITPLDWHPTPGYEFGCIVADPRNPSIVYAGGPASGIVKISGASDEWINVSPNVDSGKPLRQARNQPLLWSPTNPRELFAGFQYLMATMDGGSHWKKLSPDLGYPKGVKPPEEQEPSKPKKQTKPATSQQAYLEEDDEDEEEREMREQEEGPQFGPNAGGAIDAIAPSSVDGDVIWVGTSNGLIKLTKDHGKTWEDVSIPHLPAGARSDVTAIDASHHDPATAYVAVDDHVTGDYKPYLYRTHDFGKTWNLIVNGLPIDQPSGSFARVIRADTKRQGLLFAGTESSVYVSFDDGDRWQSLAQNLPNTSYRDMVVKNDDLVVATYGRSFWVLDDLSPLREMTDRTTAEPIHFYKPSNAVRVRRNTNGDTPFPPEIPHAENPPAGAILYYSLSSPPKGELTIDILDRSGKPVRRMTSTPPTPKDEPPPPIPDFWVERPRPLPAAVGLNRAVWNLRYDAPPSPYHSYEINANPGETPASPEGPLVEPGEYTVVLTVDGKQARQKVTVERDPRSPASLTAIHAQHELQMQAYDGVRQAWTRLQQVNGLRSEISSLADSGISGDVATAVSTFTEKLDALGEAPSSRPRFGRGPRPGANRRATFDSVQGSLLRVLQTVEYGDMAPNEPTRNAMRLALADMKAVEASWGKLNAEEVPKLNAVLAKHGLKQVAIAWSSTNHP